jgi:hypothetical protein
MPDISDAIEFLDRAFCFTGKFADLKRAAAERAVRARGGLIQDLINERLQYLVVGDVASPGWKFGAYGRKIEQARALRIAGARQPVLVSESLFMEALASYPSSNSGAVDEKVVIATFKFLLAASALDFDQEMIQASLSHLVDRFPCHITVKGAWASVHRDLFGGELVNSSQEGAFIVEYRFVRHQSLDEPVTVFLDTVARAFEDVRGVDGTLRWFERTEGSADFVRLLREVPSSLRVLMA